MSSASLYHHVIVVEVRNQFPPLSLYETAEKNLMRLGGEKIRRGAPGGDRIVSVAVRRAPATVEIFHLSLWQSQEFHLLFCTCGVYSRSAYPSFTHSSARSTRLPVLLFTLPAFRLTRVSSRFAASHPEILTRRRHHTVPIPVPTRYGSRDFQIPSLLV